jgi:hypothetical protein
VSPARGRRHVSRALARLIAEELVELLAARSVLVTAPTTREQAEGETWHDRGRSRNECSDRIATSTDGESSMSTDDARKLLDSLRRKKKLAAR